MTRKQRRGLVIGLGVAVLGVAVGLVLYALQETIVFFYSPSDVKEKKIATDQRFRLGGLVEKGSLKKGSGTRTVFDITDTANTIHVRYDGVLPDLFREGQGVVTEGRLDPTGVFIADSVLAKHDENYMPPEVAAALKKQGYWKGGNGKGSNSGGSNSGGGSSGGGSSGGGRPGQGRASQ